jgi:hypothetical protein
MHTPCLSRRTWGRWGTGLQHRPEHASGWGSQPSHGVFCETVVLPKNDSAHADRSETRNTPSRSSAETPQKEGRES